MSRILRLFFCDVDVQLSHPGVWFSTFSDFCKPIIIQPVYMISSCSSSDCGPVASWNSAVNVFVANFIPQSIASDAL